MKRIVLPISALFLGALLACGGSKSAGVSGLSYTDPSGGEYRLVKNASLSTSATHLVLDLVGPASVSGSGITVSFTVGNQALWSKVDTLEVANGTVFNLGSAPQILKAQVQTGTLRATVAEKGYGSPKGLGGTLLRVALDLNAASTPAKGDPITLSAGTCRLLDSGGNLLPVAVSLGVLTTR